jgi:hypothetical protein
VSERCHRIESFEILDQETCSHQVPSDNALTGTSEISLTFQKSGWRPVEDAVRAYRELAIYRWANRVRRLLPCIGRRCHQEQKRRAESRTLP